ncbi:transposase family protein [Streptomyces sp. HC307]|uniref:transposase family protein n=1 Tax=Streptomyces flavusporus TaxID=3385496 RepID=UPI00391740C1
MPILCPPPERGLSNDRLCLVVGGNAAWRLLKQDPVAENSRRAHGSYRRTLADAAAGGRPVTIRLTVRRFRCQEPSCVRRTIAEPVEGLSFQYGRRSQLR